MFEVMCQIGMHRRKDLMPDEDLQALSSDHIDPHWAAAGTESGSVLSLQWHPTDLRLLTSGSDGTVKVWSFNPTIPLTDNSLTLLARMINEDPVLPPCTIAQWCDTPLVAAAYGGSGDIVLWRELSMNKWIQAWRVRPHPVDVSSLVFAGRSLLLVGFLDGCVREMEINAATYKLGSLHVDVHPGHRVRGIVFDPHSENIFSLGGDGNVCIMASDETTPRVMPMRLRAETDVDWYATRHASISPDGQFIAIPCGFTETQECAYLLSTSHPSIVVSKFVIDGGVAVMGAKFSPVVRYPDDGMVIAVFSSEAVVVFTTAAATPIVRFADMHYAPLSDLSWCREGMRIAVSSEDGSCTIISLEGSLQRVLKTEMVPVAVKRSRSPDRTTRLVEY